MKIFPTASIARFDEIQSGGLFWFEGSSRRSMYGIKPNTGTNQLPPGAITWTEDSQDFMFRFASALESKLLMLFTEWAICTDMLSKRQVEVSDCAAGSLIYSTDGPCIKFSTDNNWFLNLHDYSVSNNIATPKAIQIMDWSIVLIDSNSQFKPISLCHIVAPS